RLIPAACFAASVLLAADFMRGGAASAGADSCPVSISPTSKSYTADSAVDSLAVTALPGCVGGVTSNAGWISTNSQTFSGNSTVSFTLQSNAGPPNSNTASRTGTITIQGDGPFPNVSLIFRATQSGCAFSVASSNACVPSDPGSHSVSI